MKTLLNLLLKTKRYQRRHPPKPTGGFTMIELLVGMIIAALIITPMLAFVVDILNRDVKEQAKASAEQDLQAAIDYIAQDMSQALRIYTPDEVTCIQNRDAASCTNTPTATGDPAIPTDVGTPEIVFWKRRYEEDILPVDNCTVTGTEDCLDDTFVMSLVAYYQIEENDTTSVWCDELPCPSRIARVEISDEPKDSSGSYIDGDPTDNGYNPDNVGNMASPENLVKGDGDFDPVQVLVNNIEEMTLEGVTNNKLAKITIVGNAKSRISGQFSEKSCDTAIEENKNSPYCPTVTAQVGGRSGFGSSE